MEQRETPFWLRVFVYIVAAFAFAGLAVNQYAQLISSTREIGQQEQLKVLYDAHLQQEQANIDCKPYNALAVIIGDEVFCYNDNQGRTYMAALEVLHELFPLDENGVPTRP